LGFRVHGEVFRIYLWGVVLKVQSVGFGVYVEWLSAEGGW